MNYGSGGFGFGSNVPPSGGVMAMQNGLSVVGSDGELGANPLLHDTVIEQGAFVFKMQSLAKDIFLLDPLNNTFQFGFGFFGQPNSNGLNMTINDNIANTVENFIVSDNNGSYLSIDIFSKLYGMGDLNFFSNGSQLIIDDTNKFFLFSTATDGNLLALDAISNTYRIGNPNHSVFKIATNDFTFFNPGTDTSNILEVTNNFFSYLDGQSKPKIEINISGGQYRFGNIGVAADNIYFNITAAAVTGNFDFQFAGASIMNVSSGGVKTTQPSANGAGLWQLGKKISAAVVLDATNYIEVKIDGTVYKLALVN